MYVKHAVLKAQSFRRMSSFVSFCQISLHRDILYRPQKPGAEELCRSSRVVLLWGLVFHQVKLMVETVKSQETGNCQAVDFIKGEFQNMKADSVL